MRCVICDSANLVPKIYIVHCGCSFEYQEDVFVVQHGVQRLKYRVECWQCNYEYPVQTIDFDPPRAEDPWKLVMQGWNTND